MEIAIWKNENLIYTKVYETYVKGEKKDVVTVKSKGILVHAIKVAYAILVNYKWLNTSNVLDKVTTKNKSKKK